MAKRKRKGLGIAMDMREDWTTQNRKRMLSQIQAHARAGRCRFAEMHTRDMAFSIRAGYKRESQILERARAAVARCKKANR